MADLMKGKVPLVQETALPARNALAGGLLFAGEEQLTSLYGHEGRAVLGIRDELFAEAWPGKGFPVLEGDADEISAVLPDYTCGKYPPLVFRPQDGAHLVPLDLSGNDFFEFRRSVSEADEVPWLEERLHVLPAFPHARWVGNSSFAVLFLTPVSLGTRSITFCGQAKPARRAKWLEQLAAEKDPAWTVRMIIRDGFSPGTKDYPARRDEYSQLMASGLFVFCPPGAGLYTYRFFEALSMGRIPVLVSSGVLPPVPYRWEDLVVHVGEGDSILEKCEAFVRRFDASRGLGIAQGSARSTWAKYLSPSGWLAGLYLLLRKENLS